MLEPINALWFRPIVLLLFLFVIILPRGWVSANRIWILFPKVDRSREVIAESVNSELVRDRRRVEAKLRVCSIYFDFVRRYSDDFRMEDKMVRRRGTWRV